MKLGLQVAVIISIIFSILTEFSNAQLLYQQQQQSQQQQQFQQQQQQQNQPKEAQVILDINNRDSAKGKVVAAIGESAIVICQNPGKFDYCRFVLPNPQEPSGTKTYVLSDKFPTTDPNIEYYGTGLDSGQCGFKINKVQESYNGNITCSAAVGPNEFSGLVNLFIARAPLEPVIDQEGPPNRNGYEVGQRITWKCIVRDGRPPAQIQWFIKEGEQYLPINSMNPGHRFEIQEDHSSQLFASIQQLERTIQAEDDGKFLVCRSIHDATRSVAEAKVQLLVRYSPTGQRENDIYGLQLEKSNTITIQIKSNPRPRIEWKIDGDIIEERGKRDRFIAPELQQIGPNLYNATLIISPLMVEDLVKTYYLSAFNDIGRAEFMVRISSADTPAEGLEIGAIVGIVVVLAVLLIVILLIIFARVTGKWCFASKSSKSPTSETSDTESASVIKQNNKSKRLPTFTAIFKKRNEKSKEIKKDNVTSEDQKEDEQRLAANANGENDGNDNDLKENKQLFYAELMLKPNEDKPNPPKNANTTEYAEIMYVKKPSNDTKDTSPNEGEK